MRRDILIIFKIAGNFILNFSKNNFKNVSYELGVILNLECTHTYKSLRIKLAKNKKIDITYIKFILLQLKFLITF